MEEDSESNDRGEIGGIDRRRRLDYSEGGASFLSVSKANALASPPLSCKINNTIASLSPEPRQCHRPRRASVSKAVEMRGSILKVAYR